MKDEELSVEIEAPATSFTVVDNWCQSTIGQYGYSGDSHRRIYYFKNPKDIFMFKLRWLGKL